MTVLAPLPIGLTHGISWVKGGWSNYFSLRVRVWRMSNCATIAHS